MSDSNDDVNGGESTTDDPDSGIEWEVRLHPVGASPLADVLQYAQGETRDEAIESAKERAGGKFDRVISAKRLGPTEEVDFL